MFKQIYSITSYSSLCSSSLSSTQYNDIISCKLNCSIFSSFNFPSSANVSCFTKKLYSKANATYVALYSLKIKYYSYESSYLYSSIVKVSFKYNIYRKIKYSM